MTLLILYLLVICYPQPFFRYSVWHDNIRLYSTAPIPPNAVFLLKEVQTRLATSPAYDGSVEQRIFICGSAAGFAFFTNFAVKSSGLTYVYLNRNIFLRPSDIRQNRLTNYSGLKVMDDRTLVYYMAHEVTHSLTVSYIGVWRYHSLPKWLREGYADYVGKGHDSLLHLQRKFEDCSYQTNREYLGYELMAAYLLDIRNIGLRDLLEQNHVSNLAAAQVYMDSLKRSLACSSAGSLGREVAH
ncbi:hypothetical protein [Terriglobus albidus]|uniref:hypothetical protein n=1 Tax=Terriglobus albidus TaxID=1592106 RepID=UPI0021DFC678|nr:hypothetical protein [Terriglobus albidus]